jgi:predicted MPP superfamily phosphohydrolase
MCCTTKHAYSYMIQAAGQWHSIVIDGVKILLTGNELPWYRDADKSGDAPDDVFDLRILLSHSPDQISWAKVRGFDLMFAGHTHGGQIAFPLIGPIVAPSKYGVRYAAGTYQIEDMIMHVSRGISGDEPIRLCCPPELGLFTIRSSQLKEGSGNSTRTVPKTVAQV